MVLYLARRIVGQILHIHALQYLSLSLHLCHCCNVKCFVFDFRSKLKSGSVVL